MGWMTSKSGFDSLQEQRVFFVSSAVYKNLNIYRSFFIVYISAIYTNKCNQRLCNMYS
jgi:hypothetical protein